MRAGLLRWARRLAVVVVLAAVAAGGVLAWSYVTGPLVELHNLPEHYARRSGAFAASVVGTTSRLSHDLAWRLNDGDWQPVRRTAGRAAWPDFVIDLPTDRLAAGENSLELRAEGWLHRGQTLSRSFLYDPEPPPLPLTVDWRAVASPDAQDGAWETFLSGVGDARVRVVPGHEDSDRVVAVTGAFPGGRRVTVDAVMRRPVGVWPYGLGFLPRREYGFGIAPLWGGHPDRGTDRPGRGLRAATVTWSTRDFGVAARLVERIGETPPRWRSAGLSLPMKWNGTYRIVAEAWPVRDAEGHHRGWRMRAKFWWTDQPEPADWLEVEDLGDPVLPEGEYGVALVAHRTAADFGPVTVEPLAMPPDDAALTQAGLRGINSGSDSRGAADRPL
ncbi:MAG: hypothetical protein U1E14_16480 [Geminicoccaceae bacterium]